MARISEFAAFIGDVLAPVGGPMVDVSIRAMFGGYGVYCDGIMFALIADDRLYLKVDDTNRSRFEQHGLQPFRPFEHKPMTMSYYPLPHEVLDDHDALIDWAGEAYRVAVAARRKRPADRGRRKRSPA